MLNCLTCALRARSAQLLPSRFQGGCRQLLHKSARQRLWQRAGQVALEPCAPLLHRTLACQAQSQDGEAGRKLVAVVAFGGNALLSRGEPLSMEAQWKNATKAAESAAALVREGMRVCVTHGNGPQVGLLALQDPSIALDVLDAETEGQIGYVLETQLANSLPSHDVVTLLTQTLVDPNDPGFAHPTKPIGPVYEQQEAERLSREKGWAIAQDGSKYRRVVASPQPQGIVEAKAIALLLENGVVPICCGGGGIPVAVDAERRRRYGVEAVVDKDLASAVLAAKIGADWLLMLTDCDAIYDPEQWPTNQVPLKSPITPQELAQHKFAAGSMAPKVEAACRFVQATGGKAGVGRLQDAVDIVRGRRGTVIAASAAG